MRSSFGIRLLVNMTKPIFSLGINTTYVPKPLVEPVLWYILTEGSFEIAVTLLGFITICSELLSNKVCNVAG